MCERCEVWVTEEDLYLERSVRYLEPIEPIFNTRGTIIGQAHCPHCGKGCKHHPEEGVKDDSDPTQAS